MGGSDSKWKDFLLKFCKHANAGDLDSIPGLGRSPGEENGYLLKYSCLEPGGLKSMGSQRIGHD